MMVLIIEMAMVAMIETIVDGMIVDVMIIVVGMTAAKSNIKQRFKHQKSLHCTEGFFNQDD